MPRRREAPFAEDLEADESRERAVFRRLIQDYLREESQDRLRSGAQAHLARAIGVSNAWVSKFLNRDSGTLSLALMRRIASATGVPLAIPIQQLGIDLKDFLGKASLGGSTPAVPALPDRIRVLIQEAKRLPITYQQLLIAIAEGYSDYLGTGQRARRTCSVCGRRLEGLLSGGRCDRCEALL